MKAGVRGVRFTWGIRALGNNDPEAGQGSQRAGVESALGNPGGQLRGGGGSPMPWTVFIPGLEVLARGSLPAGSTWSSCPRAWILPPTPTPDAPSELLNSLTGQPVLLSAEGTCGEPANPSISWAPSGSGA